VRGEEEEEKCSLRRRPLPLQSPNGRQSLVGDRYLDGASMEDDHRSENLSGTIGALFSHETWKGMEEQVAGDEQGRAGRKEKTVQT